MKKNIKKELLKLFTGELASIFVFIWCYFIIFKEHKMIVIYPFSILLLLLAEASIYWLVLLIRTNTKKRIIKDIGKYYLVLKYINLLLFIVYIPMIFIEMYRIKHLLWGIFLFLFAAIEYINYFYIRLSYPNIGILIRQFRVRSLRKSRIAKEISNYKK